MNQVLSQAEVDALLNAVADGAVDAGAGATPASADAAASPDNEWGAGGGTPDIEVISYDLTNQDRVIRGRMPTLDIIYERFIRLFRMSLSNALRKIATISIILD